MTDKNVRKACSKASASRLSRACRNCSVVSTISSAAGQCGAWVSELLPHTSQLVDKMTIVRSMTSDQFNHAPAQLMMHTGNQRLGYASIGSWVTYGLGSEPRTCRASSCW
ncbi:MAG: DUF1501 domain-containing protein [Bryobacterales bacterium]